MVRYRIILFLSIAIFFFSCNQDSTIPESNKIFQSLTDNGITFNNKLEVNDSINFFTYGYYYMGGGVAIGDFNQDDKADLFFTGNMVDNHLYLNQGDLAFKEVGSIAGIQGDGQWMTGATMVDINHDGKDDLYVSVAGKWKDRSNLLFVNQGLDENGIPVFENQAEQYGIADAGNTIQSVFFDYDRDGDLDLYVGNYEPTPFNYTTINYIRKMQNFSDEESDHLYRNNGDGTFTDVSKEAGIYQFGLTIGLISNDFNNDGWPDLYVSNDFHSPDRFFINNGDGTFTNHVNESMMHTAFYGMGIDAADYNRDGLLDIFQLDMAAADNYRSKANMASMDIQGFRNMVAYDFGYQYMYNALQTNKGVKENGNPFYGETAKISGLDKTDWSWACIFSDYDNDGYDDLFITNGTKKDINNKDYFKWLERVDISLKVKYKELGIPELLDRMPSHKIDNFIFKNIDGERFEKSNDEWGLHYEGFSNGAAYADLDNDGDLEIIVNNIDSTASIFKNLSAEIGNDNTLQVRLKGPEKNVHGIGARVELLGGDGIIMKDQTLVRGFQSSIDPVLHFGLGAQKSIKQAKVTWHDGKQEIKSITDKRLIFDYNDASSTGSSEKNPRALFTEIIKDNLKEYKHIENEYDDFKREILLPHKMSHMGPSFASLDLDGDGIEDFYVGGSKGHDGSLFLSSTNSTQVIPSSDHEDTNALFLDVDNDGDMDLYVSSGGNEMQSGDQYYRDRLYINDGLEFIENKDALPEFYVSSGKVCAADFNKDGKMDLLVAGRQVPGSYPNPESSLLLENLSANGNVQFKDVTENIAPDLKEIGMVTDMVWRDMDGDEDADILIVGEWMDITIMEFNGNKYESKKEIKNSQGWWNSCVAGDFDGDGDLDIILGNLGENYKYKVDEENSFDIYASDFDENGRQDVVLSYEQDGQEFPVRGKQCSSEQIPSLKRKFTTYDAFAKAELSDIYQESKLKEATHYSIDLFSNAYLENTGGLSFNLKPLPLTFQESSINDFAVIDYDSDGDLDLVAGGNLYEAEVETPRNDACFGFVMQNDGKGNFEKLSYSQSGIYVPYETRHVEVLENKGQKHIHFITNEGPIKVYAKNE